MNITCSKATTGDTQTVTELMLMLYENNTLGSLYEENEALLLDSGQSIFLASDGEKNVGFAHCALRHDYVEGTNGGTVGYLEGIYVTPENQRTGVTTAREAFSHAYHGIYIEDTMTCSSQEHQDFVCQNIFPRMGKVHKTDTIVLA